GSASAWGAEGRRFESGYPDHLSSQDIRMRKSLMLTLSILLFAPAAFAGEPKTYGEALPEATAVPLSVAAADTDAHAGKANRFSGRITEVCQKEGCWMMLE